MNLGRGLEIGETASSCCVLASVCDYVLYDQMEANVTPADTVKTLSGMASKWQNRFR
jgi:hypothetical protein